MNLISWILLGIVMVAVVLAIRSMLKGIGGSKCGSYSCGNCPMSGSCADEKRK